MWSNCSCTLSQSMRRRRMWVEVFDDFCRLQFYVFSRCCHFRWLSMKVRPTDSRRIFGDCDEIKFKRRLEYSPFMVIYWAQLEDASLDTPWDDSWLEFSSGQPSLPSILHESVNSRKSCRLATLYRSLCAPPLPLLATFCRNGIRAHLTKGSANAALYP